MFIILSRVLWKKIFLIAARNVFSTCKLLWFLQRYDLYIIYGVLPTDIVTMLGNVTSSNGTRHWAVLASAATWRYVPGAIIVVGTFANLLAVCVLARRPMRRLPSSVYLLGLAVTDTATLWLYVLPRWLRALGHALLHVSDVTCKVGSTLPTFLTWYSAWLLVAVTVQRYVAVSRPFLAITVDTRKTALVAMSAVGVALAAACAPALFAVGAREGRCDVIAGYETFVFRVFDWIDLVVCFVVPFFTILVLNCLIVYHVRRSFSIRKPPSASDPTAHLTTMLLVVTSAFLVTSLPIFVILLFYKERVAGDPRWELAENVALMINSSNHALNFFFYCASGVKFRKQLRSLFRAPATHSSGTISTATH